MTECAASSPTKSTSRAGGRKTAIAKRGFNRRRYAALLAEAVPRIMTNVEELKRASRLVEPLLKQGEAHSPEERALRALPLKLIDDHQRSVNEQAKQSLTALLASRPGMTLEELFGADKATMDEVYLLLASNEIYVDLRASSLVDADQVRVFLDQETAFAYSQIAGLRPPSPADGISSFEIAVGAELSWDGRLGSVPQFP